MADIRAILSNSNFNLPATWFGGAVPGPGDVAFANGNTVLVSDTRTVQAISNAAGTGITVGGTFSLLNECNLTCTNANGVVQGATGTSCVTTASLGVGSAATLAAAVTAGGSGSAVRMDGGGTLTALGNYVASNQFAMNITAGTVVHTGTLTGGAERCVLLNSASATLIQTGDVTGGGGASTGGIGLNVGTVIVTGTVTGGTGSPGINLPSSGTISLTVNGVCRSSATQPPISAGSNTQNVFLSGPFQMGLSGNINPLQVQRWMWAPMLIPSSLEVARSDGTTKRLFYTPDNIPTANYPTTGSVRSGVIYGPNNDNVGTLAVPDAASVALGVEVDNRTGTAVLTAANVQAALTSQGLTTTRAGYLDNIAAAALSVADIWSFATRTLTSGGGGGGSAPTAAEVAAAVWAHAARTLTTTIPTAVDVATAVWAALTRTLTASSDPSAATIATAVRTELAAELGRVDAAVSTRLAAASYTAPTTPPTAAAIRVEMDANSTKLANLDATISSRLAAASYSAAPTTAAIRTELSVELARLDASVSSRLAPAGTLARVTLVDTTTSLTNGGGGGGAPSAAQVATAVRTELTPELARVANCSTVDTTATAIQDAVGA